METWFTQKEKPQLSKYSVMGLCCPAPVCLSILRETFNPKTLIFNFNGRENKETAAYNSCTNWPVHCVTKKVQFGRFRKLANQVQNDRSPFVFLCHVCRWEHLCSPFEDQGSDFSASAVSHHPTANPPFISPNQYRGGTIPVQLDTEIPRDSGSLMLEDWQSSTDQSST